MIPVIIESPFKGETGSAEEYARNRRYLQRCIRDCLSRGETPYASHQMLTDALDDRDPVERARGIEAGEAWRSLAAKRIFYIDHEWSSGMLAAREWYDKRGLTWIFRRIGAEPSVDRDTRDELPTLRDGEPVRLTGPDRALIEGGASVEEFGGLIGTEVKSG